MFLRHLRTSVLLLALFTIITGLLYPILVTIIAQVVFPTKANGSLIVKNETIIASELIGQPFSDPRYFWSRPSATGPVPYNAAASSGSNYGPLNPALLDGVTKRVKDLKEADRQNTQKIPVDLVTASGSGLDPHISVASAHYQIHRVAHARKISEDRIRSLVDQFTEGRQLGFFGEACVNVLKLNVALDEHQPLLKEK